MKKITFPVWLLGCLCLLVLLTGCWNRVEIENRAIVAALAVDKAEQEELLEVTAQIIKPGEIKSAGGGEGGNGGGGAQAVVVYSGTGHNMFEALRNIAKESKIKPYLAEVAVLILGEELARENISTVMDWMSRNPEPRLRAMPLVARGQKAKEIVATNIPTDKVWGLGLSQMVKDGYQEAKAVAVDILDYLKALESTPAFPVLTGLTLVDTDQEKQPSMEAVAPTKKPVLSGTAVFNNFSLVGWLNETQTRGLLWIQGQVKGGVMVIPTHQNENELIALEIIKADSQIEPLLQQGQVAFKIKIKAQSALGETPAGAVDTIDPQVLASLKRQQEEVIAGEIWSVLNQAQVLQADIFGLGEAIRRSYPREWPSYEKIWEELWPTLAIEVEVHAKITRIGMTGNPVKPERH